MTTKSFIIGLTVSIVIGLALSYLAILGIGWLYHNGDPLIREWFG